jgi:hypothetical protein
LHRHLESVDLAFHPGSQQLANQRIARSEGVLQGAHRDRGCARDVHEPQSVEAALSRRGSSGDEDR